jgi:DNA-binding response OmpR family regulator
MGLKIRISVKLIKRGRSAMIHALIISRDKSSFKIVENVLQKNGIQTAWSDNSDDALSMLMDEPNDLVIVDEMLPGMIGRSFIEKVIITNPD